MQISVSQAKPGTQATDCLVLGVYSSKKSMGSSAEVFDAESGGYLKKLLKQNWFKGDIGETLWMPVQGKFRCKSLLLVGCGRANSLSRADWRKNIQIMAEALRKHQCRSASITLLDVLPEDIHIDLGSQWMSELIGDAMYQFTQCKGEKSSKKQSLRKLVVHVDGIRQKRAVESGFRQGLALNAGKNLARDLANLPGNICTPSYLASQARKLASKFSKISVSVMEEAGMRRLGMGALLSVAAGSRQPAKLITLQYKNNRAAKPVVLVGKGVTFDSGGISIKPAAAMDEMKYDMCGAASVLGTFRAVAELGLPINLIGIIPSTENLPDGAASKPGDIVTSLSGQTIEILNTDAEGRLILCDALTYAARFKPKAVIDIATLTGACVIALGSHPSGLLGNQSRLISNLREAGDISGDRVWELPLWDDYQDQLKSPFADMANVGGREAGTITAGCFLSRFTKEYHWAHLDIAGTAWRSGTNKGATGRPVPLLLEYLKQHG